MTTPTLLTFFNEDLRAAWVMGWSDGRDTFIWPDQAAQTIEKLGSDVVFLAGGKVKLIPVVINNQEQYIIHEVRL